MVIYKTYIYIDRVESGSQLTVDGYASRQKDSLMASSLLPKIYHI
jgi:hypothetical protein